MAAKLKSATAEINGEKNSLTQLVPRILVVDDEEIITQQLGRLYKQNGYNVEALFSAEEALLRLEKGNIDLIVTDVRLQGLSGVELTRRIQEAFADIPVIVITGHADTATAVETLKLGASDFIMKPFSASAILESTRLVLEKFRIFTEIRHLQRFLKDKFEFGGMLSKTPEMHKVFETIRTVSATDTTVLVEGETGTGKELVAKAIHYQSARRSSPFVAINCAGFPETLLESELFGYERGAFTGADQSRPGKIELANGGTLFFDEIESISLTMQAKLLRMLEDRKVQRLGSTQWVKIDMRVIAASNVPLKELVDKGEIRRDFYYRINVIPIYLMPLRQRREDIPLLVQDFLRHHPLALRKRITRVSAHAMRQLMQWYWPGNIRELHNVLERSIVTSAGGVMEKVYLPDSRSGEAATASAPLSLSLREWLRYQERKYLLEQLESFGGKIGLIAKNCGIDTKTLYRKLRIYGLEKKTFRKNVSESFALVVNKGAGQIKDQPPVDTRDS